MADAGEVRDAVLRRQNERHTEALRAERDAVRLEVAIDRAEREVARREEQLDHAVLVLEALKAKRQQEGK